MRWCLAACALMAAAVLAGQQTRPLAAELPPVPPPADAIVLFDGTNADAWRKVKSDEPCPWRVVDGALVCRPGSGSIETRQSWGDQQLHLQFAVPHMPEASGQGKGNSGVYLQGRYEVQVLDSFGLEPKPNECGAIYGIAAPLLNACLPPETWQTYDILFRAPRFGAEGQVTEPARITVLQNGVAIHHNQAADHPTTAAPYGDQAPTGPLYLQDHGNTVRYRNVWVRPVVMP